MVGSLIPRFVMSAIKRNKSEKKERAPRFKTKAEALNHLDKLRQKMQSVRLGKLGGTEKSIRPIHQYKE